MKFTFHIKCDFISSPNAFKPNKIKKTCPNAYFSIPGLDFVLFQRSKLETN